MGGGGESVIAVFAGDLTCTAAFDCDLDFDKYGGIVLWFALMLYMFKALGVICDEYFVPSLEVIVDKLQLSNDVAGATFMAAGSSAPELFTNLVATFFIVNEGGVGTIVGSAIFNILVIVGATGLVACKEQKLKIWWYPLCRDCFFYVVSIIELVVFLADEHVKVWESIVMVCTYLLYCIYMKYNPQIVEVLKLETPLMVDTVESLTDIKVIEADNPERYDSTSATITSGPSLECIASNKLSHPGVNGSLRSGGYVVAEDSVCQPECHGLGTIEGDSPSPPPTEAKEGAVPTTSKRDSATSEKRGQASLFLSPTDSAPPEEKRRPSWSYADSHKAEEHARRPSKQGLEGSASTTASTGVDAVVEPSASSDQPESPPQSCGCRDPMVVFWEFTMPAPIMWGGALLFSAAIFYIFVLTYVMVDSTNRIGTILHIPPLAMALVFLAAGTSIPDALGSIAVAKQGEGDMAICNALGSNVFDILIGLGVPWGIKTGIMQDEVAFEGKFDELIWDVFVLIFVLVLFVFSLVVQGWYLSRSVGYMLLSVYFLFLVYNVLMVWVFEVKKMDET